MQELDLVNRLKQGDTEAFASLFEDYAHPLLRYLARLTGRNEMAEDLVHDTLLMAVQKIAFFEPRDGKGLKAWLFRIGSHLAIDRMRREKKLVLQDEPEDAPIESTDPSTPQIEAESSELREQLASALDALTPGQRSFLLLKEQEGLSCLEISRICGCSENAVKQGLFRARIALRKKLCI